MLKILLTEPEILHLYRDRNAAGHVWPLSNQDLFLDNIFDHNILAIPRMANCDP